MATLAEVMEALRRADAAGNEGDARRLAGIAQTMRGAGGTIETAEAVLPSSPNPVPYAAGLASAAGQGATFGALDEIGAGLAAIANPSDPGAAYDAQLERSRARATRFAEENPVSSTIAEIGGAVPTALMPLGALGKAAQSTNALLRSGAGAAIGVAQGGTYGFLSGEDGPTNRLTNAMVGGAVGGTLGAAAPLVGTGVRKGVEMYGRRGAAREIIENAPTPADLARQSQALYREAENAGVVVKPEAYKAFAENLQRMLTREGIDEGVTPTSASALRRVLSEAQDNRFMSVQDLNIVRRVMQNAAGSPDANERRLASMMMDNLDEFVEELGPDSLVGEPAKEVGPILREARDLWGRMRRAEMIDDAVERATNRAASTGSGGNVNNAIRQNLRQIIDSPSKRRGFSAEEIEAIRSVVRGTPTQNALRLIGKISPQGNGLSLMANLGAAGVSGGATLPLTAVGIGAKAMADRSTGNANRLLQAMIVSGRQPATRAANPLLVQNAERLTQRNALFSQPLREQLVTER